MKEKYKAFKAWKKDPKHRALYQLMCWFGFFSIVYLAAISGLFSADYTPRTSSESKVVDLEDAFVSMESFEYEYDIQYEGQNIKLTGIVCADEDYFEINGIKYYSNDEAVYLVDEENKQLVEQTSVVLSPNVPLELSSIEKDNIDLWLSEGEEYESIEYNDGSKNITYIYLNDVSKIQIRAKVEEKFINNLELDLTEFYINSGYNVTSVIVSVNYNNINNISSYDRNYDEYTKIDLNVDETIEEEIDINQGVTEEEV